MTDNEPVPAPILDPRVVATFRFPIRATDVGKITKLAAKLYGPDLRIALCGGEHLTIVLPPEPDHL